MLKMRVVGIPLQVPSQAQVSTIFNVYCFRVNPLIFIDDEEAPKGNPKPQVMPQGSMDDITKMWDNMKK